jgi:hypothetical protein
MTDPLSPEQRARVAAAHEAARSILTDDPLADDVVTVAHWIVTGQRPAITRPSAEQVADAAKRTQDRIPSWDAATWRAEVAP